MENLKARDLDVDDRTILKKVLHINMMVMCRIRLAQNIDQ